MAWYAINARDFTPVYSTGNTGTYSSKWYTVDGTITTTFNQASVSYANSVGIGAVYSKLAVCGYTFSTINSGTYDIWGYIKSYDTIGAYLRLNGGSWNSGGTGTNSSTFSWIKLGTFSLKNGDKIEVTEEGGVGGGSVIIKDFYIVTTGSVAPTYIPTGQEGNRTSIIHKFLIKQNSQYYSIKDNVLTELGTPTDDTQKEQWFNYYGVDDLKTALLTPDSSGNKLIDKIDIDDKFQIRMMKAKN